MKKILTLTSAAFLISIGLSAQATPSVSNLQEADSNPVISEYDMGPDETATLGKKPNLTLGQEKFQSTCVGCHGTKAEGGVGPKLEGQLQPDISRKLHEYKAGKQIGPMSSMMIPMAMGLSDEDIENISFYLSETFHD